MGSLFSDINQMSPCSFSFFPDSFLSSTNSHTLLECYNLTRNVQGASFNALLLTEKQDILICITLLCAFRKVGVGAKEDGEGHLHIHLTECCLSFLHCGALIKQAALSLALEHL